ncbi:uncharacterized protein ARMOST_17461 [Armillaria ostoyae]|uniref:Uncharacterized protein n=1 Tax=Armillaria ostoyae TaxID=47428 RepID=A0A284RZ22_ARMOS|nr:uncharacterized protein ARMOST_17461 [Armillaria ostoyae]
MEHSALGTSTRYLPIIGYLARGPSDIKASSSSTARLSESFSVASDISRLLAQRIEPTQASKPQVQGERRSPRCWRGYLVCWLVARQRQGDELLGIVVVNPNGLTDVVLSYTALKSADIVMSLSFLFGRAANHRKIQPE